jgi:hypothetical protein
LLRNVRDIALALAVLATGMGALLGLIASSRCRCTSIRRW